MHAAVRRVWVVDNMAKIGPGGFYHLAFAHSQIHPDMMREMRRSSDYGKIHIHLLSDDSSSLHVASGEVIAIHWFPEFIRIHFMIENVHEVNEMNEVPGATWGTDYMLTQ